jgi:hypothetical protein
MKRFIVLCCAGALTACAGSVQVNAWDKGDLAKPIMAFEADSHDTRLIQHVRVSKEAASGGYGVGGGGCGCN